MPTTTVYSAAGDGIIRNAAVDTWANVIGAATGTVVDSTTATQVMVQAAGTSTYGDSKFYCDRQFFAFDTSSLPDDAIVTDVKLGVYITTVDATSAGGSVNVFEGTQASTTTLATSDFDAVGSTAWATAINFTSLSAGAYNEWTFNSTGRAAVSLTGSTKVCLRSSLDSGNSAPTGANWSAFSGRNSEYASTTSDPYLTITYSLPDVTVTAVPLAATVTLAAPVVTAKGGRDNFTDTDGTLLESHTPSGDQALENAWVKHTGAGSYPLAISSANRVRGATGALGTVTGIYTNPFSLGTANYDVSIDFEVIDGSVIFSPGVVGRWDHAADGGATPFYGYSLLYDPSGSGTFLLYRHGGSGDGNLGTYTTGLLSTGSHSMRLSMSGSTIKGYLDTVERISVTETSITAANRGGIRMSYGASPALTGSHIDNFEMSGTPNASIASPALAVAVALPAPVVTIVNPDVTVTSPALTAAVTLPAPVPAVTATGVIQSGSPQTITPGSGNADGLNYNSFAGLCEMPNGNLLVAYHHANNHVGTGTNELDCKIGTPDGSGGYTWGSAVTLTTTTGSPPGTGNIGDPSCITLANGDVMVIWNESTKPAYADIDTIVYYKYRKSSDNGATWAATVSSAVPGWATTVAAGSPGGAYAVAPCPPIQLANGDLLMATYGWDDRAVSDFTMHEYTKCVKSTDNGVSWSVIGTIFPDTADRAYDETAILELDTGEIIAVARTAIATHPYETELWVNRSYDQGVTWGTPSILPGFDGTDGSLGYGGRPSLHQTPNGGLLIRYRIMATGTGLTGYPGYALSLDRGYTWTSRTDPYDGAAERTGTTTNRLDVYGAFAAITEATPSAVITTNKVAYAWSEELGSNTTAALYFRVLTVTPVESRVTVPAALAVAVTLPPPQVTTTIGGGSASITSPALAVSVALPIPTVTATAGVTVTSPALAVAVTLPAPVIVTTIGIVNIAAPPLAVSVALPTPNSAAETGYRWFRTRRSSMSTTAPTKTYVEVLPKGTTRTTAYTSPTYIAKTEAGILVVLDVTAASGTGGLTLRINAHDQASSQAVPLNAAPTAVTATGTTSYALYPFGVVAGSVTQATSFYLPRMFSISVAVGDASSYTYSLGYCLLP